MSDNKKYYYLKLKEDFFDSPEIKVLESMTNGYKYSNLLLKLYLKALKFDGALRLNEYIPYNVEMISAVVGMDIDTVRSAFALFKDLKLVEILSDGTIYMLEIQNFIGKSTTEADRKRNYRRKIEDEKTKLIENGQMSLKCPDKNPPEIEIEIEIEKDINNNIYSRVEHDNVSVDSEVNNSKANNNSKTNSNNNSAIYKEIIDYLNSKADTNYKHTTNKTQSLINARSKEGFTLEDFKAVIDIKTSTWKDTEMEKYLRPQTLFGTNFESYLNEKEVKPKDNKKTETPYQYDYFKFD